MRLTAKEFNVELKKLEGIIKIGDRAAMIRCLWMLVHSEVVPPTEDETAVTQEMVEATHRISDVLQEKFPGSPEFKDYAPRFH